MVQLRSDPEMRGFRFTAYYTYREQDGYLAVELAVSDGKHPTKKEIVELAEIAFVRERVSKYGKIGKTEFQPKYFEVCIINIQEFSSEDYFNWIGYKKKEE